MRRDDVLQLLRAHRDQLKGLGVRSLAVFGSMARDEATERSDVDFLVEFEGEATFDGYMDTKFFLEDLLECSVDLVTPEALRPQMRPRVEKEAVYVT